MDVDLFGGFLRIGKIYFPFMVFCNEYMPCAFSAVPVYLNLTKSNIKLFNTKLDRLNLEVADLEAKEEYYKAEIQRTDDNIPSCLERLASEMLTLSDLSAKAELESEDWKKICATYIRKITLSKSGSIEIELQSPATSSTKNKNGSLTWIRTKTK